MAQIFTVIAPLFLIIFVGAVLQRSRVIGDNWQTVLNEFALKVGYASVHLVHQDIFQLSHDLLYLS